ncbi:probable potassium voltage-gated channel subfamily H member 7 [Coccomyxa sp. Obi]|nr:probable potassium voltage-gated channel subfamily H member 7 [Coccomyxa sp. Obi]
MIERKKSERADDGMTAELAEDAERWPPFKLQMRVLRHKPLSPGDAHSQSSSGRISVALKGRSQCPELLSIDFPQPWDLLWRTTKRTTFHSRSIFGLPIISPFSPFARAWSGIILALDLVYTAFLIPLFLAFELPDFGWTWAGIVNLIAGTFYYAELLINFHVGFIGKYGAQKKVIMDGKAVAWYYTTQGTSVVDALTATAWFAQITLIVLWDAGVNVSRHAVTVYLIIRLLRLIRCASLMKRLYATTNAAGNALLPASSSKTQFANFATLIYTGLAVLSFLSCLMNYVVRKEHCKGTWINYFGVFLHTYGSEDSMSAGVLSQEDCSAIPDPVKWLGGAYFMLVTMLTIGYGDVTPQSITEIIICMFCIIVGIIFFGILLGTIADALKASSFLEFAPQYLIF